jgi:3-hydroxyacyl-CoA dehydrogenase
LIDGTLNRRGVVGACFQRTIAEDLDIKRQLFASLDVRDMTGVQSATTVRLPSHACEGLATRNHMFSAHYFMPAGVP